MKKYGSGYIPNREWVIFKEADRTSHGTVPPDKFIEEGFPDVESARRRILELEEEEKEVK